VAKNDIFYQFEPTIVIEFISAFRDAMQAYGDWNGQPETVSTAATAFFESVPAAPEFVSTVTELIGLVDHTTANKMAPRPITLADVGNAKVIFDGYIRVKAQRFYQEEVAKLRQTK
jgi:hypothetical protein